jgi:hypothetical protein
MLWKYLQLLQYINTLLIIYIILNLKQFTKPIIKTKHKCSEAHKQYLGRCIAVSKVDTAIK